MIPINERLKKSLALIGPWPIEPLYLGALAFFMVASLYSIGDSGSEQLLPKSAIIRPILSLLIATLTYLQLKLMRLLIPQYRETFLKYFLILFIQSFMIWTWVVFFRNLFPSIHTSSTSFLSPVPIIRFLFTMLCINAFIGLSRSKLEQALAEKESTLKIVEEQSNLLLEHDETTRRELSEFLHDRVQSSLVTACLELQQIKSEVGIDEQKSINAIIDSLEKLRAVDVRNAAQTLSPAVGNADLATSISVMTKNYAPQVELSISISEEVDAIQNEQNREIFLGIYRIIEQSFLNAIIHGKASRYTVEISAEDSSIKIRTSNDGRGIPVIRNQGLGTAIINAWVRTLGGTWSIYNNEAGEAELSAVFPRLIH